MRQSGMAMLRFADLQDDHWLIEPAQRATDYLLRKQPDIVLQHPKRWREGRENYLKV